MISADLSGKRTLITGAASGIGLAAAELFARNGATVAMNDLPNNPNLDREIERLSGLGLSVLAAPGNVADPQDCRRMVSKATADLGGLDHLINNAGTPATKSPIPPEDLDAIDEGFWDTILAVNLVGPYRCVQSAADALRESRGSVVNTCSVAGLTGIGSSTAYATSKAGLINMTQGLAKALGPDVRVNAIAPGVVDSPWECQWPADQMPDRIGRIPLKRAGVPQDYAEGILFLAGAGAYITGHTLVIDGGLTA
tara:strand:- start:7131 stop:7892 length:762 start_codon:yes stop_codon:yes gene_type:complete